MSRVGTIMSELAGGLNPLASLRAFAPGPSAAKADRASAVAASAATGSTAARERDDLQFDRAAPRDPAPPALQDSRSDDREPPAPIRDPLPSLDPERLEPNELFQRQSERISGQIKAFRQVRDRIRDLIAEARGSLEPEASTEAEIDSAAGALELSRSLATADSSRSNSYEPLDVEY